MLFRRALLTLTKRPKSSLIGTHASQFDEMPTPKSYPVVGTTLSLLAAGSAPHLHKYIDKRHQELGPIFKETLGPVSAVFISDPDEMRAVFANEGKHPLHVLPDAWVVYNQLYGCSRGLFFMDGTTWSHHRKIMNRLLLKGDLKWIEQSCEVVSHNLIQLFNSSNEVILEENLENILYKWSLDVLVSVLMGAKAYQKNRMNLEEKLTKLASIVNLVFQTTSKLALIPSSFASRFKIPRWNRFVRSVDNALYGANDLVSDLIENYRLDPDGLLPKLLNEDIEKENVKKIIADLILAAGDTTAYAMEWMLYLLAKNPKVQEDLRSNNDISKYIMRETLRLYPVAPFLTRILPNDSIICNYVIPKGTLIVMSIYTSGRDDRYFKTPEAFIPQRWMREDNRNYSLLMQRASLPFAMGLRSCIGKKIAETQLQNTLVHVVNNFQVSIRNTKDVDVILKMVAVPSEPIRLRFRKL